MEIGGIDLILEGPVTSDDLTVMYRLFQAHWPGLEVYKEEGTEGEWFACRDLDTYRQFLKGDPHRQRCGYPSPDERGFCDFGGRSCLGENGQRHPGGAGKLPKISPEKREIPNRPMS